MVRRVVVLAVAALAVVVTGLAVSGGAARAAEDGLTAEERLAQRHAPVMMLVDQPEPCGPGEPYVPSDVDAIFDESSIALRGPWAGRDLVAVGPSAEQLSEGLEGYALDQPGDPLKPGCDFEKWADRVWGPDPRPTIYAHVATEPGVEDRIALQYFFFYPFNDYNNKHEADWERIQVEFQAVDAEAALGIAPDLVVYSQHYGSERADWDDDKLTLVDDTRPVVFVAAGSHASQYDEGLFLGRSASEGFGCDTTVGPHDEVLPEVRTIPSDPAAAAAAYPWTTYRGHWGEVGPQRFYEGPTGPAMKQAWRKPFTWSATAREDSFSLPGADVAGNEAAEYFCTVVGAGSDVFRRFSADPAPTLLVILGVLLLLGWVVRRSGWGEAEPTPLHARRPSGQVVAAGLKMLARHRRLFLLLAAPAAAVSVASSVLTATTPGGPGWWGPLSAILLVTLVLALAWGQLASAQAVADLDAGRAPTLSSLARATRTRLAALLVTVAVWALVVVPLLVTGVLAPVAVGLLVAWSLSLPVVQLEGLSGWRALRRSAALVRPQVVTVLLVVAVSIALVSMLGGVIAAVAFIVSPAPFGVVSAIPPLVTTLAWPVTALLTTYAWANGRTRVDEQVDEQVDEEVDGGEPAPEHAGPGGPLSRG
jgi:hypothetical protein